MILIEKYHLVGNARGIQMYNQLYWYWQGEQLQSRDVNTESLIFSEGT